MNEEQRDGPNPLFHRAFKLLKIFTVVFFSSFLFSGGSCKATVDND